MLIYLQLIESPEEQSRFEHLYTTYRGLMLYVAEKILHNRDDAEDAVHDAFLSIAKNFDKISTEDRNKTKALVVIIVESKAIDIYRKNHRYSQEEYSEETIKTTIEYSEGDELVKCILKLPTRSRDFILLKYDYGYSNMELAELMGISQAGVRKLNQRAKESLEKICKEEGVL